MIYPQKASPQLCVHPSNGGIGPSGSSYCNPRHFATPRSPFASAFLTFFDAPISVRRKSPPSFSQPSRSWYTYGADGTWTRTHNRLSVDRSIEHWIHLLERRAEVGSDELELVDTQRRELADLAQYVRGRSMELSIVRSTNVRNGMPVRDADAIMQSGFEELSDHVASQFEEILFEHQHRALIEVATEHIRAVEGPFVILSAVDVGEREGREYRQALEVFKRRCERLREDLIKREREMLERCLAVLKDNHRRAIWSALGDRPQFLEPSTVLLQLRLENP